MEHAADRQQPTTAQQRWQRRMAEQPVPPAQSTSGFAIAPLYTASGYAAPELRA